MEDFHLLEKITLRTSAEKIKSKIKQMNLNAQKYVLFLLVTPSRYDCRCNIICLLRGKLKPVIALHRASDLIMKVDALLTASPKGEARKDIKFLKEKHRCSTKSVCTLKRK